MVKEGHYAMKQRKMINPEDPDSNDVGGQIEKALSEGSNKKPESKKKPIKKSSKKEVKKKVPSKKSEGGSGIINSWNEKEEDMLSETLDTIGKLKNRIREIEDESHRTPSESSSSKITEYENEISGLSQQAITMLDQKLASKGKNTKKHKEEIKKELEDFQKRKGVKTDSQVIYEQVLGKIDTYLEKADSKEERDLDAAVQEIERNRTMAINDVRKRARRVYKPMPGSTEFTKMPEELAEEFKNINQKYRDELSHLKKEYGNESVSQILKNEKTPTLTKPKIVKKEENKYDKMVGKWIDEENGVKTPLAKEDYDKIVSGWIDEEIADNKGDKKIVEPEPAIVVTTPEPITPEPPALETSPAIQKFLKEEAEIDRVAEKKINMTQLTIEEWEFYFANQEKIEKAVDKKTEEQKRLKQDNEFISDAEIVELDVPEAETPKTKGGKIENIKNKIKALLGKDKEAEVDTEKETVPKPAEPVVPDLSGASPEMKNEVYRKLYFELKNRKPKFKKGDEVSGLEKYNQDLALREKAYKDARNKIVKGLADAGKDKELDDFLLNEAQEKLKNERNTLPEKIKRGISKGIEMWDKWGVEERDKDNKVTKKGKAWKRIVKMVPNLALIGLASSKAVELMANQGYGSAYGLAGGTTSLLGKKLGFGLLFGSVMEKIPGKHKRWVGLMMSVALSAGTVALTGGGAAVVGASSAVGYGLARTKSVFFSEKKIEKGMSDARDKNKIDKNKIEDSSQNLILAYEKQLKKAENYRLYRKLLGGAVAIAGSAATIELAGMAHDHNIEQNVGNWFSNKWHNLMNLSILRGADNTTTETPVQTTPIVGNENHNIKHDTQTTPNHETKQTVPAGANEGGTEAKQEAPAGANDGGIEAKQEAPAGAVEEGIEAKQEVPAGAIPDTHLVAHDPVTDKYNHFIDRTTFSDKGHVYLGAIKDAPSELLHNPHYYELNDSKATIANGIFSIDLHQILGVDKGQYFWQWIRNTHQISASDILHLNFTTDTPEFLKDLHNQFVKLEAVTHLTPTSDRSPEEWMVQAYQKAMHDGTIDQVRIIK